MRRWVAILILVLVPLQFSAAAVAAAFVHDSSAYSPHTDHHEPHHNDAGNDCADDKNANAGDLGCGVCHACCAVTLCATVAIPETRSFNATPADILSRLPASPSSEPERPNWTAFA